MVVVVQRRWGNVQWHMITMHAHYLNSSSGKFFSMIHTIPDLHQVFIICFSHLNKFLAFECLRSNQETKDIVQKRLKGLMVAVFNQGIRSGFQDAINYMATMWRSSLM
jgi:hypothetical protein